MKLNLTVWNVNRLRAKQGLFRRLFARLPMTWRIIDNQGLYLLV